MKSDENGWVVVSKNHPNADSSFIVSNTFKYKRTDSINEFVSGSNASWDYWKRKYNFRCVRATRTIEVKEVGNV